MWLWRCAFLLISVWPFNQDIPELTVKRKQLDVEGVKCKVTEYFRGEHKVSELYEDHDGAYTMSKVFGLDDKWVYRISFRRGEYFAKDIAKALELSEEDADLDGVFDLIVVRLNDERNEYFEIIDPYRIVPLESAVLRLAAARLKNGEVANESDVVIQAYLETRGRKKQLESKR